MSKRCRRSFAASIRSFAASIHLGRVEGDEDAPSADRRGDAPARRGSRRVARGGAGRARRSRLSGPRPRRPGAGRRGAGALPPPWNWRRRVLYPAAVAAGLSVSERKGGRTVTRSAVTPSQRARHVRLTPHSRGAQPRSRRGRSRTRRHSDDVASLRPRFQRSGARLERPDGGGGRGGAIARGRRKGAPKVHPRRRRGGFGARQRARPAWIAGSRGARAQGLNLRRP